MSRPCAACGREFEARRSNAKYCSDTCRQRGHRNPKPSVDVDPGQGSSLVEAARVELAAVGREGSALGLAALALAAQISVSPRADLVREFRATLAAAVDGAASVASPLDELRARRDRKRTG